MTGTTPSPGLGAFSRPPRAGFSLVEVIVALLIFTVGVLGLAGTTGYVMRQSQLSSIATERAQVLQAVIERLNAMEYADVVAGSWTVGTYSARWTVDAQNSSKEIVITTTGPGVVTGGGLPEISNSVVRTFTYRILRP